MHGQPNIKIYICIFAKTNTPYFCGNGRHVTKDRLRLKCDGTCAENKCRLPAKRTRPFKSAGGRGRQFSQLLAAEVCASAVVILDTPSSEVVWRVLATHSIRHFPYHFPSRVSPCAITFQLDSNAGYIMLRGRLKSTGYQLHSPVSPSLPLPCVTVCHHISTGLCHNFVLPYTRWVQLVPSKLIPLRRLWILVCPVISFNPLNPELNPICYLLALLRAHHFLHVSRIRVKLLTLRRLMSYIYGAPILDVSRSHTTTQHSR